MFKTLGLIASNQMNSLKGTKFGSTLGLHTFDEMKNAGKVLKGQQRRNAANSRSMANNQKSLNELDAEIGKLKGTTDPDELIKLKQLNGQRKDITRRGTQLGKRGEGLAEGMAGSLTNMGGSLKNWATAADMKGAGGGRAMAIGARAGAVVGGSVALGTGVRAVNGGGMTYNNRGERDIAGIPLI